MDGDRFNPALEDLLRDPLTRRVMASDNVDMTALIALLAAARRRLADTPDGSARG
jgi:hypothetical protein